MQNRDGLKYYQGKDISWYMENDKFITVVVMVYKNFSGLETTISSIIDQKYENIELIVSDDGSSNFKNSYFNRFESACARRFKKYKLIHNEENIGTVKHFNNIIKISNGDIIVPLSSGDKFINNDVIGMIDKHFNENNCLLCTSQRKELGGNARVLPKLFELNKLNNCKKTLNHILLYGNFIGGATTYYSRNVFEKYGYFDEKYTLCEDLPFFIKMLSNDVKISPLSKITIGYNLDGISSSKKRNPLLDNDYVNIFKNALNENNDKLYFFAKRALKYRIEKYGVNASKAIVTIKYLDIVGILICSTILSKWRS